MANNIKHYQIGMTVFPSNHYLHLEESTCPEIRADALRKKVEKYNLQVQIRALVLSRDIRVGVPSSLEQ